jgi:hypothetical protein
MTKQFDPKFDPEKFAMEYGDRFPHLSKLLGDRRSQNCDRTTPSRWVPEHHIRSAYQNADRQNADTVSQDNKDD